MKQQILLTEISELEKYISHSKSMVYEIENRIEVCRCNECFDFDSIVKDMTNNETFQELDNIEFSDYQAPTGEYVYPE